MQLDGVRGHPCLAVVEIEEGHASDHRSAVKMNEGRSDRTACGKEAAACMPHRPLLDGASGTLAVDVRELEDHRASRVMGLRDNEMEVVIVLEHGRLESHVHPVATEFIRPQSRAGWTYVGFG
jgi:hypothetical protein